jgi:hypothetical protein
MLWIFLIAGAAAAPLACTHLWQYGWFRVL